MNMIYNPYMAGDPVGKLPSFVGREDVLREVMRIMRHRQQNAITLFGQRRVGKTSILQYLQARLPDEGAYHPVYFDLMNFSGEPLDSLLRGLAGTIARVLELPQPDLGEDAEIAFREQWLPAVLTALPAADSLVLLMDEFDVQADPEADQKLKKIFFTYMRQLRLVDTERLKFVFVLGRTIDDLDIVAQGLFKNLPTVRVSLLGRRDAERLIRLSEQGKTLAWTDAAVDRIWDLTGGHPYLMQALCSEVWELAYEERDDPPPVQPTQVDEAIPEAMQRSDHMFDWLWKGLGPAEKVAAAALAGEGQGVVDDDALARILAESGVAILIGELRDAPRQLQKWDILEPANGGYRFRVELLRRWIAENKPLDRTQNELDRINPAADSLYQAGKSVFENNDLVLASGFLRQALGLNPSHLGALELSGEIDLAQGNLDEAQKAFEQLHDLSPARARARLKQIYLKRAEIENSDTARLEWYDKILALQPSDPDATEGKQEILLRQEEAKKLTLRFLEGKQALAKGEWEDAQNALLWVVQTQPDYADNGLLAATLLAKATEKGVTPPPRWQVWLLHPQRLIFLAGGLAVLFLFFIGGMGNKLVDVGTEGYGPLASLATETYTPTPTFTPTSTDTPTPTNTATPTFTPTSTNTPTPTFTPMPTNTPTPTSTPTPWIGTTITRSPSSQDGMVMVYVPAGTFQMGSEEGSSNESPVHAVTLNPFWMDEHEVTNKMYQACTSCDPPDNRDRYDDENYLDHPVVYVSWEDARAYCAWADARLPTEAEWEYAARGGLEGKTYPWGDDDPVCTAGAENGAQSGSCDGSTTPAKTFAANGYNLYDMAGNVWEWTADWYDSDYYSNSPQVDPQGPEDAATYRVLRGGSWFGFEYYLRVALRSRVNPTSSWFGYGFRCARSP